MKRWSCPVIWMVAVFLVLGACAPKQEESQKAPVYDPVVMQPQPADSEPQPAAGPIKIGALFSVTGSAAWLGEPEKNSAIMAVEELNARGGINGRKIELIVEDTEGDDTKGVLAAKKLIGQDKVIAIIGPSRSGTSMAVIPIITENEIPLISCAAAASIVVPVEERKWIFKTPQMDSDAVIRIYEHLLSKGMNRIGILSGTTGFGKEGRDHLKKLAPEMGIEILADETYNPTDTDMTAQLTKIKASDAQAVVNWSIVPAQSIVPKNMRQLAMTIPLYQSHGFGNIKYAQDAGVAAEGLLFPCGPLLAVDSLPDDHPQKDTLLKYRDAYEARFKETASAFGGYAYDAINLVIRALEMGPATSAGIRDSLEQIQGFVGISGVFNLSPEDHCGLTKDSFAMLTVQDGKFVVSAD